MRPRLLSVGIDPALLRTREALLVSRGYDCVTATPIDIDEALKAGPFDLAILSVMLSQQETRFVAAKLTPHTSVLQLTYMVQPNDLFEMVAAALNSGRNQLKE